MIFLIYKIRRNSKFNYRNLFFWQQHSQYKKYLNLLVKTLLSNQLSFTVKQTINEPRQVMIGINEKM